MTEQLENKVFKINANPYFWKQKSIQLKHASEILWIPTEERLNVLFQKIDNKQYRDILSLEPDTFSIYVSLIGFSIEALIKGIIIQKHPEYISDGKLCRKLTNHNLIELFKMAQIKLTSNERIFCQQAFQAMTIDSRYPVAKSVQSNEQFKEIGGHCKDVYETLFNRLSPLIQDLIENRTDS